jgi:hypothetical protein
VSRRCVSDLGYASITLPDRERGSGQQGNTWLIKFDGEEYGPYSTKREAMLFAIEAAHALGQQGEDAQVLCVDENRDAVCVWTYGRDAYPPAQ